MIRAARYFGPVLLAIAIAAAAAGCGDSGSPKFGGDAPALEETYGSCTFCHKGLSTFMFDRGGHGSLDVKCQLCHEDLLPGDPGPGHRSIPACADCHSRQETHGDLDTGTMQECLVCHNPHGSTNLFVVRTRIDTPGGETAEVEFTNLDGQSDGGFTSASDPGSGLCEVCHTQTRYYRNDGTGGNHFTLTCFTCHPHTQGFRPQ
jgi:hypothetical protein